MSQNVCSDLSMLGEWQHNQCNGTSDQIHSSKSHDHLGAPLWWLADITQTSAIGGESQPCWAWWQSLLDALPDHQVLLVHDWHRSSWTSAFHPCVQWASLRFGSTSRDDWRLSVHCVGPVRLSARRPKIQLHIEQGDIFHWHWLPENGTSGRMNHVHDGHEHMDNQGQSKFRCHHGHDRGHCKVAGCCRYMTCPVQNGPPGWPCNWVETSSFALEDSVVCLHVHLVLDRVTGHLPSLSWGRTASCTPCSGWAQGNFHAHQLGMAMWAQRHQEIHHAILACRIWHQRPSTTDKFWHARSAGVAVAVEYWRTSELHPWRPCQLSRWKAPRHALSYDAIVDAHEGALIQVLGKYPWASEKNRPDNQCLGFQMPVLLLCKHHNKTQWGWRGYEPNAIAPLQWAHYVRLDQRRCAKCQWMRRRSVHIELDVPPIQRRSVWGRSSQ